eukprot:48825-Pyramimonas_sp.AAC.2
MSPLIAHTRVTACHAVPAATRASPGAPLEHTRSRHQSQKERENITIAGTDCRRGERTFGPPVPTGHAPVASRVPAGYGFSLDD